MTLRGGEHTRDYWMEVAKLNEYQKHRVWDLVMERSKKIWARISIQLRHYSHLILPFLLRSKTESLINHSITIPAWDGKPFLHPSSKNLCHDSFDITSIFCWLTFDLKGWWRKLVNSPAVEASSKLAYFTSSALCSPSGIPDMPKKCGSIPIPKLPSSFPVAWISY